MSLLASVEELQVVIVAVRRDYWTYLTELERQVERQFVVERIGVEFGCKGCPDW